MKLFVGVLPLLPLVSCEIFNLTHITDFNVTSKPAFLSLHQNVAAPGSTDLVITSFGAPPPPFIVPIGRVSAILNVASQLKNRNNTAIANTLLQGTLNWPNAISESPAGIFPNADIGLTVADGFIPFFAQKGGIYVLPCRAGTCSTKIPITPTTQTGFIYHHTQWIDVDGDGHQDILTARARVYNSSYAEGELVWFKQPVNVSTTVAWTEQVISTLPNSGYNATTAPDNDFIAANLDADNTTIEIVSAHFFTRAITQLSITSIRWNNATQTIDIIGTKFIDDTIQQGYFVELVDFNGDGKQELFVGNHGNTTTSGLWAYEIPTDVINGTYTRHIIQTGFELVQTAVGAGTPGFAYAVYPRVSDAGKPGIRPYLLVAGDGSEKAYLLTPYGDLNFTYESHDILVTDHTIGSIAYGDIDADGWTDVFIPVYEGSYIAFFSFAPNSTAIWAPLPAAPASSSGAPSSTGYSSSSSSGNVTTSSSSSSSSSATNTNRTSDSSSSSSTASKPGNYASTLSASFTLIATLGFTLLL